MTSAYDRMPSVRTDSEGRSKQAFLGIEGAGGSEAPPVAGSKHKVRPEKGLFRGYTERLINERFVLFASETKLDLSVTY